MHEALSKVKQEMGEDAVIVKNRKISRRSGGKLVDLFEVTAALEEDLATPLVVPAQATQHKAPQNRASSPGLKNSPHNTRETLLPNEARHSPAAPTPLPDWTGRQPAYDWKGTLPRVSEQSKAGMNAAPVASSLASSLAPSQAQATAKLGEQAQNKFMDLLRNEFRDVKERVEMPTRELRLLTDEIRQALAEANSRDPIFSEGLGASAQVHEHLIQCGFDRAEARRLLIQVLSQTSVEPPVPELIQALRRTIVQEVRCTGGVRFAKGRATRIAIVGPGGAGKTTTLLKLAAIAAIRSGKRVGILSGDSMRLGAHAQLEVFGKTSGMPVFPVYDASDLNHVAPHAENLDLLLLDTAGRAPQNGDVEADRQLQLVHAFAPDETLLVLSATTRCRELENQCRRFQAYRPASLALTRLDECMELGTVQALVRHTGLPLSYLCDGPSVPEHIQTAKPHHLAHLLLPETKGMRSLVAGR